MSIFSSKQEQTIAEKLAGFKSTFVVAHTGAVALQVEIEDELQANAVAVALAKQNLSDTEKLKKENDVFITNLSKLI